jgi:quercetin dioxygenase-like cupin family protein
MPSEAIAVGPLTIRFLVEGDESNGSLAIFEVTVPPGARVPAPHSHDAYEETMYGLEGTMTWTIDGEPHATGPGEAICIKRGAVHGFVNDGDETVRQLAVVSPAIIGPQFFRDMAAVIDAADGPPDPAALGAVMRRHGLTPAPTA